MRSVLCRGWCVVLFLAWTAEAPGDPAPYAGQWNSFFLPVSGQLFVSLPTVELSVWQLMVLLLATLSLLWPQASRRRALGLDIAVLVSLASIALTVTWGVTRGGSAYQAYFQLWRFAAALIVGTALTSVVRTTHDIKILGSTLLAAALVRGALAGYFYLVHVRGVPPDRAAPYMTTHDDSLLFVAGVILILSWALERRRVTTLVSSGLGAAFLCWAMILNRRRLAWLELILALALMYVMLPPGRVRRRVNAFLFVFAGVVALYVVVGWGRQEAIFEPLRAFSTSGSHEDSSSLARLEEIRNLLYTLSAVGNPLLGTGWGHPYVKVTSVYANFDDSWWQYLFLPHNSLLGIAVSGGLVGLLGIWLPVPATAFAATRGYRRSTHQVDRSAAIAALCVLPAYGAHCYGDLGFQSLTCGLILSVAIAVAGRVPVSGGQGDAGRSTRHPTQRWRR